MTFILPENVYQTSNGGGTGSLTLVAPPAGRQSFADFLSNGDTTIATISDLNDTETSRCTFNTGPDRLTRDTLIRSTTGGLVNFSGGGVLNIASGMPGVWMEKFADSALGTGLVVRLDDDGDLVPRTLGAGTWISWTNPNGVPGNPTIVDSAIGTNFARKSGAVAETITGPWTFDELMTLIQKRLVLDSLVNGSPKEFILRGSPSDDSDMALRLQQQAVDSYLMHLRIAAAWKRVLTTDDIPAVALGAVFEQTGITIANAQGSYAHGLGAKPKIIEVMLECTSATGGYAVGDEVKPFHIPTFSSYLTIWCSATNVGYSNLGTPRYLNKASTALHEATSANWDITLRAFL